MNVSHLYAVMSHLSW